MGSGHNHFGGMLSKGFSGDKALFLNKKPEKIMFMEIAKIIVLVTLSGLAVVIWAVAVGLVKEIIYGK